MQRILTKLYHVDIGIEDNSRSIVKKNKELATLREQQGVHDGEVEVARAQLAKARAVVMQKEKNIKKADKALDGKVCRLLPMSGTTSRDFFFQRPELVATEAQILHATRKMNNAAKSKEELLKNKSHLQTKVSSLEQELGSVKRAADRVQGSFFRYVAQLPSYALH